ncbi:bifunctional diaminohydroxyphosphoribosylaminopyrimidine deaminase/5-amino-6-(5-phosphoribosylamino)uracil reductase RibD [Vibrio sp. Of7-15]|uniref:bifunctional diaminohydroxyphosphoribosylaminopyrimidine deaminase/5-amino-6-(5-phosphoribosylamino)uracil reductase RibD n=1 Tax=Vibrio sp. Of7-15 TaxID=2724879 RepID=UPI001EF3C80C|nr:bifunctional diaminohydroxyphosphoribosylaminopyrimidine deaminase/5-amino-6-(5-phosphoribosylamino)uracil reductase RibD [Vibrio sp. Of7-15]MCG7499514.1 bifunctional diaminohydroxyphosphoribosylaminopyrimidine deaminase/5-amino-6-(5-phosphoribosylamino)uracil reductase RibD [Vibrio sp. Of7-15]
MMLRAIKLAQKGIYTTAPNPNVGCVITQNDQIVGEGFHAKAGEPHAEVHALRQAGAQAKGATVYVTLEPCSHYGRTPPCSEALIKAGVKKVICAMVDPNPQVAGRGVAMLREAGIEVEIGLLEQASRKLNPGFIKKMESGRPYIQLKLAASLDGKTALSNGKSQWITSSEARHDVQRYRAKSGAILSTSSTVVADNASLTVRWSELGEEVQKLYPQSKLRQPARIILDRQQQLKPELQLFNTESELLLVSERPYSDSMASTVETLVAEAENNEFDLIALLHQLAAKHHINHIWVEAGATLAASLVKAKVVDELILYLAPKLMGTDSRGLLNLIGLEEMSEVLELNISDVRMVGKDIRITATFTH